MDSGCRVSQFGHPKYKVGQKDKLKKGSFTYMNVLNANITFVILEESECFDYWYSDSGWKL